jgi:hypothetical protein
MSGKRLKMTHFFNMKRSDKRIGMKKTLWKCPGKGGEKVPAGSVAMRRS